MAGPIPYAARGYDNRDHTARVTDLIGSAGHAGAQQILDSGDRAARMWQTANQVAQGVLSDVVNYSRDSEKRTDAQRKAGRAASWDDLQKMIGTLPPDQAIKEVRAAGFVEEADAMQSRYDTHRTRILQEEEQRHRITGERLEQAGGLFSDLLGLPEAQRAARYPTVVEQARKIVGPELATRIPDTYDPGFVQNAVTWGMDASQRVRLRADALAAAQKKTDDRQKQDLKLVGTWLATSQNAEDWQDAQNKALALNVSPDVLNTFPAEFSPKAVEQAALLADVRLPSDRSAGSDYAQALTRYAKSKGLTSADELPWSAEQAFKRSWESLERAPTGTKKDDEATVAQRGAAERWKQDSLADTEKWFAEASANAFDAGEQAKLQQELEARKTRIQQSYQEQLGMNRFTGRPPVTVTPPGAPGGAPPPPASPAPPGGPGPQPPAAGAAPPPVQQLLQGQKPGTYTLTDGSTWRVDANGTITPLR